MTLQILSFPSVIRATDILSQQMKILKIYHLISLLNW